MCVNTKGVCRLCQKSRGRWLCKGEGRLKVGLRWVCWVAGAVEVVEGKGRIEMVLGMEIATGLR